MKRIMTAIFIILLIIPFFHAMTAPIGLNLIANPSFKRGTDYPVNWTLIEYNGNAPVWSNASHDGSKSIKISVPGTTDAISGYPRSDPIKVLPNTSYEVSAWGRTKGTGGTNTPAVRVVELDSAKNWIRQINLPVFNNGTNDWEQKSLEFTTDASTAYLYIYSDIWNGYGTFWLDEIDIRLKNPDVTITPVPAPDPGPILSPIPSLPPSKSVIAFASDAETVGYPGEAEEIKDLNAMLKLSPLGSLDAIVFAGDMSLLSDAKKAIDKSNLKDVPYYFTVGNHEAESSKDLSILKSSLPNAYSINPGPAGSEKTTYSFDVGNIHIAVINTYWDGKTDEGYFKYGGTDGGWIPSDLMSWIDSDLNRTTKPYKIVVFHDPLYPAENHVGESLDANKENRDQLQSILEKNSVSLAVSGHTQYAYLKKYGTVWHANTGGFGTHMHGKYDGFASVVYAYDTGSDLKVMWTHENPTWATPKTTSYTIDKPT